MDSSLISTIIGAGAALAGSFGATSFAQYLTQRQDAKKKKQEKIEEIIELALEVKMWLDLELNNWWEQLRLNTKRIKQPLQNCPIDKLVMLTNEYAPFLDGEMVILKELVSNVRTIDYELRGPDSQIRLDEFYAKYITDYNETFVNTYKKLDFLFKQMNKGNSRRSVQSLIKKLRNTPLATHKQIGH